ncbi:DUF1090 family protein [Stutzerimonas stutzeri]|uniref:DUF1090 family protein n=1 Tax=Stutzerimonas stutzeri TaxID=316 RepID=UPI00210A8337|nr:DUF1090 family protein [Stutzerimonas stutzeri]MCQ4243281.1 DUF1090 domain-containing protein [Stutzerimonas stutzeri]
MSFRHWPTALILACAATGPLQAIAAESNTACNEQRQSLREQLQQARLQGDRLLQNRLDAELQELCRGLVTLRPGQVEHQQTLRQIERRETLLREALATGNAQLIELRRNQLARTREKLASLPGGQ